MIMQIVTFKSGLSDEEAVRTMDERAPQYRALPGLLQKLYFKDPETGEYGGLYVWKDEQALAEFRRSELAKSIPEAYRVEGEPRRKTLDVVYVLREESRLSLAA
jgi:hypothetical protein